MKKETLSKHIWIAIGIFLLGILIGIVITLTFIKVEGIFGIFSSIILAFLAFAFSYYQFYLNKFDSERRRVYDLKYQAIMTFNREGRDLMDVLNYYLSFQDFDTDELFARTLNKVNRLKISTQLSNELLFINIKKSVQLFAYLSCIDSILFESSKLKNREYILDIKNRTKDKYIKIWKHKITKIIPDFYIAEENLYKLIIDNF